MIAAGIWLAMQVPAPSRPATLPTTRTAGITTPPPPAEWPALPPLSYRRRPDPVAGLSDFVRDEVRAGRCTASRAADGAMSVEVDLAVLVGGGGPVRRIVPRAINCPTVEQYASGLVERMSRDNLDTAAESETWYHTALSFAWRE